MYIPYVSPPRNGTLERRKGGGGGGRGGGGGSSSGGGRGGGSSSSSGSSKGGGSSSSSGSSKGGGSSSSSGKGGSSSSSGSSKGGSSSGSSSYGGTSRSPSGSPGTSSWGRSSKDSTKVSSWPWGKKKPSSHWGSNGGGTPKPISSGPFAGRTAGGGTRDDIYGSRAYGSGYPGSSGYGVSGRGFPYYFWPVVWGGAAGVAGGYFAGSIDEYGHSDNSSRPGGALTYSTFSSNSNNAEHSTFHVLSDSDTMNGLYKDITTNCSSLLDANSSSPTPYNSHNPDEHAPKAEQVVQYYRASSIALSLEGYNNSATFKGEGAQDDPLPDGYDGALMYCLNGTIASSAMLMDAALPIRGVVGGSYVGWVALGLVLGKIAGIV